MGLEPAFRAASVTGQAPALQPPTGANAGIAQAPALSLSTPHSISTTVFSTLSTAARRCAASIRARLAEWRRRARSRRDLMALSERELWDLRLTRSDALNEAGKPFWKK